MKKTIYFIIESNIRELDTKILVSLIAAKKGIISVIAKKSRLFEKLHLIRPGIIFLKSFGRNYEVYLSKIKFFGHTITGLDEESLQIYDKYKLIGNRFSKKILPYLKFIFCVGKDTKKIYEEYFKKNKSKIETIISGHPKFDILKKISPEYFKYRKAEIKKKYGKFILIATQFPFYNLKTIDIKNNPELFEREILKKLNYDVKKKFDKEKKNFSKIFLHQKKNFYEYEKLFFFLNKKFPDTNFLIRPHPAENKNYYTQIIKNNKFQKFSVLDTNESIIPFIMASDMIISFNSTVAIESFILKKMNINYIPIIDNFSEFKLNKFLSINVNDHNKIYQILKTKNYKKRNIISNKNIKIAKEILNNLVSTNAAEKIVKKILSINSNPMNLDNKNQNYYNYFFYLIKTKLINFYNFFIKRNTISYKIQFEKRRNLNKKVIQAKVNRISKILYPGEKFIVKEKYYGLYYIEIVK